MLCLAFGLAGCSESNGKKQKIRKIEGIAKMIDLEANKVSMTVKNDKGDEHEIEGTVRPDAEVLINGRKQRLEDIRPGDRVVVFGYREGKGEDKKLVATRVVVTRPRESDWKSTEPTTPMKLEEPAEKPEPAGAKQMKGTIRTQMTEDIRDRFRVKLLDAMEKREALLKAGKAPTDPEVLELDKIITNARNFLGGSAKTAREADADSEERREQLVDMIYAQFRIEMQGAIEKRAALLKAGKAPSDPEIRQLEGKIMRARQLLTEAGEIVEEIDPPIVEVPKPGKPPVEDRKEP
jgi:hypothetical protein